MAESRVLLRQVSLTVPMRDLLWTVAQHKYGWTHASRYRGELQVADALVRRGLVTYGHHDRDHPTPIIVATDAGRVEIERRWPVSPFALETYEHQPGGWTPREGVVDAAQPARERCGACGKFLPKDSLYTNRCSDCWGPEDEFLW